MPSVENRFFPTSLTHWARLLAIALAATSLAPGPGEAPPSPPLTINGLSVQHDPIEQRSTGHFITPNERAFRQWEPIVQNRRGVYIGLGTFRALDVAALSQSSRWVLFDNDPAACEFNERNVALIRATRSRFDYLWALAGLPAEDSVPRQAKAGTLSWREFLQQLQARISDLKTSPTALIDHDPLDAWITAMLRETGADHARFFSSDAGYERVRSVALRGQIHVLRGDLTGGQALSSLGAALAAGKETVDIVDLSNALHYAGGADNNKTLETNLGKLPLAPDAVALLTGPGKHATSLDAAPPSDPDRGRWTYSAMSISALRRSLSSGTRHDTLFEQLAALPSAPERPTLTVSPELLSPGPPPVTRPEAATPQSSAPVRINGVEIPEEVAHFNSGAFITPNERAFRQWEPLVRNRRGVYVGVGTFRALTTAAMTQTDRWIILDHDSTTSIFNRRNLALIRSTPDRFTYFWRLAGLTDDPRILARAKNGEMPWRDFETEVWRRVTHGLGAPDAPVPWFQFGNWLRQRLHDSGRNDPHYFDSDAGYARVRERVLADRVTVLQGDVTGQETFAAVNQALRQGNERVEVVDLSNIVGGLAQDTEALGALGANLRNLPLAPDAVALFTVTRSSLPGKSLPTSPSSATRDLDARTWIYSATPVRKLSEVLGGSTPFKYYVQGVISASPPPPPDNPTLFVAPEVRADLDLGRGIPGDAGIDGGNYVAPNELSPHVFAPVLVGRKGVLLSVGTIRALADAGRGQFSDVVMTDYDAGVVEFNLDHAADLRNATNGLDYLGRLLGVEDLGTPANRARLTQRTLSKEGAQLLADLEQKIRQGDPKHATWRSDLVQYLRQLANSPSHLARSIFFDDTLFRMAQSYARAGRLSAIQTDWTKAGAVRELARQFLDQGKTVDAVDLSNAIDHMLMEHESVGALADNIESLPLAPDAVVLFTHRGVSFAPGSGRILDLWRYYAVPATELVRAIRAGEFKNTQQYRTYLDNLYSRRIVTSPRHGMDLLVIPQDLASRMGRGTLRLWSCIQGRLETHQTPPASH